jgi:transposase
MNRPHKYVSPLNDEQIAQLKNQMKTSASARVRMRAHGILLSSEGYGIDEIAHIYHADRDSVSSWIDKWEQSGTEGLFDKPRSGKPPALSESEIGVVMELIKEHPHSPKIILARIFEKIGKIISISTLKRLVRKMNFRWKRMRKSVKNKRDETEFEKSRIEIEELKEQHRSGKIDLRFFDESGFSLGSFVPYGYQPIGETIEIETTNRRRLNVLGFMNTDNQLESFCFECTVDTRVVIRCFDEFSKIIKKKTVVILDNSSTHRSEEFEEMIPKWKKKGLFVKYLPEYSPELNLVEILWRFVKYEWLPLCAYLSFASLVNSVEHILKNFGSEFQIDFA